MNFFEINSPQIGIYGRKTQENIAGIPAGIFLLFVFVSRQVKKSDDLRIFWSKLFFPVTMPKSKGDWTTELMNIDYCKNNK